MLKYLFLCILTACPIGANAAQSLEKLKPFFGAYRTKAYNGVENHYSNAFFVRSIHIERTVKLRRQDGEHTHALKLNFQVPLEMEDGSIYMKHLFAEAPTEGSVVFASEESADLFFAGTVQELVNREWVTCAVAHQVSFKKKEEKLLQIDHRKMAEAPCTSENHSILAERVDF